MVVVFGLPFLHSTAHAATSLERDWQIRSYVNVLLCLFFFCPLKMLKFDRYELCKYILRNISAKLGFERSV